MTKYYLWLVQLFQPANPQIHHVLQHYGSAETAYREISGGDTSMLGEAQLGCLGGAALDKAESVEQYCAANGIDIITIADKAYPMLLKEIYNPPVLLFCRGSLSCLENLCITVVGARNITPYIAKLCTLVSGSLAKAGVTVVSGMARGVDFAAHSACIRVGKPTVGVLACGIDYDYPKNSGETRRRIVANGGAYITELFPKANPSREYFRARNRILAGLSSGTAVFQAGAESGSLITAGYAVDENRDVFCVPPPDVFDPRYCGVVSLLRDGAISIYNHDDILSRYIQNF